MRADLTRLGLTEFAAVLAQARIGPREIAAMAEGAPINTDNNGLILFNAPLYVHSSTISQNAELLIASSRGVAEYLEFPGATPEIEGNFLRYLAAAYLETGFLVEGTRTQLLAERQLEEAGNRPPE